ncbi:MAG: TetR/AcrR family transcriptional regulator [Bacteroidota bacterium]
MAKDTKKRILNAALSCFNEQGYFNVRLQDIADKASMSVGNMAYHFQHKTELLNMLFADWQQRQQLLMADLHLTPIFENFDHFLEQTYALQEEYLFLYLDQLELIRSSKEMQNGFVEYFQDQEEQLEILLALYEARGVLENRVGNGIALRVRRGIDTWRKYQLMEGIEEYSFLSFKSYVWLELEHYFTDTGETEYSALEIQKIRRN